MNPEIEDPLENSLDILVQNACLIVKPDQKALELEKGLFRNLTVLTAFSTATNKSRKIFNSSANKI